MTKKHPNSRCQTKADWDQVRKEYEAGVPVSKLAKRHSVSKQRIYQVREDNNWQRQARPKVKIAVAEHGIKAERHETPRHHTKGQGAIGSNRSVGQPMGEVGGDGRALSNIAALENGRVPENVKQLDTPDAPALTDPILQQAAVEIELTRTHRKIIARAAVTADNILTRLHALVVDGQAADVITFKTKKGEAYHRVPFLGDRESVSDALLKCVNAVAKLVPLERQAHGLTDDTASDTLPRVTFNMPNVRVVSVDGKGHVAKYEDQPAPIEGELSTPSSSR